MYFIIIPFLSAILFFFFYIFMRFICSKADCRKIDDNI